MRKGELTFENIFAIAFLAMFLATVFAVYQFYSYRQIDTEQGFDIVGKYSELLEILREDTRFATNLSVSDNGFRLDYPNQLKISYLFKEGKFIRTDINDQEKILLLNLESAGFKQDQKLKKLLTLWLFPKDKMQIPFFTSFALRGGKQ